MAPRRTAVAVVIPKRKITEIEETAAAAKTAAPGSERKKSRVSPEVRSIPQTIHISCDENDEGIVANVSSTPSPDSRPIVDYHGMAVHEDQALPWETQRLHDFITGPRRLGHDDPVFFIEVTPRASKCKLPTCRGSIKGGEYRLALHQAPSMYHDATDFYHISCFEKIADLSQVPFLDLVEGLSRHNIKYRGVNISTGNHLLDCGAERLVAEWKVERKKHIAARDGVTNPEGEDDPNWKNLMQNAGAPGFNMRASDITSGRGINDYEFQAISTTAAPNESDGPEDQQVWNLFDRYLAATRNPRSLHDRHDLSKVLVKWSHDVMLAKRSNRRLPVEIRKERARLGPKAIKALTRLSTVIPVENPRSWDNVDWSKVMRMQRG